MDTWTLETPLSGFERSLQRIAAEERAAREKLQGELRRYTKLLIEIAGVFMAQELDAQTRVSPYFLEHATPDDWRSLLAQARAKHSYGPVTAETATGPNSAAERWRVEAERLQAVVNQLQVDLNLARAGLLPASGAGADPAAAAAAADSQPSNGNGNGTLQPSAVTPAVLPAATRPSVSRPITNAVAEEAALSAAWQRRTQAWLDRLPALPVEAPARYKDGFKVWEREGLALLALGTFGWAMRQALADVLSRKFNINRRNAGSLRTIYENLAQNGFIAESKIGLSGIHRLTGGEVGTTQVVMLRLTPRGRAVLQAIGVPAINSEWDILAAKHGGQAQFTHTTQVCVFTYQARSRGYTTAVCPDVAGPSAPDVQIALPATPPIYVEVEAESGTEERRMVKWANQFALQGQVALCALHPEMRATLITEAKNAGAEHGLATDLQTLYDTQEITESPLWADTW